MAVLNSNQDVLRLIREALQDEGHAVVTAHIVSFKDGAANLSDFLNTHRPSVMIYDLAPPYQENWAFLQLPKQVRAVAAIPIVLTTVNKNALEQVAAVMG